MEGDRRRVALNACVLIIKHAVMAVLGVVFVGYLARKVGVTAWGELQAAVALSTMVTMVAGIGVRAYVAREVSVRPELGPRYLGAALLIRGLSAALLLSVMVGFVIAFGPPVQAWLVIVVAASQLAALLYTTLWLTFETQERFQYILYMEVFARLFVIALACTFLRLGHGIIFVALAFALGNAIELALAAYFLCSRFYRPRFDARPKELWGLARQSLGIGLFAVVGGALQQVDRIMLRVLSGEEAVGVFSAASVLSENFNVISDLLLGAAFAMGMRLFARDEEAFARLYRNLLVTAALVGLPMAAGVCLLGPDIIALVYRKPEFLAAGGVLRILAWQLPLAFAFRAGILPLMAARRELVVTKILAAALVGDVLLNLLLIPRYRATGAALSTLAASLGTLVATTFMTARWVRLSDVRRIGMIGLVTALMAMVAFAVRAVWGMWAAAAAGAVLYPLLLLALRVVTRREIWALLRRRPKVAEARSEPPAGAGAAD